MTTLQGWILVVEVGTIALACLGVLVGTIIIAVRFGKLPDGDVPSDEGRIRDAMTEAQAHPGRTITR